MHPAQKFFFPPNPSQYPPNAFFPLSLFNSNSAYPALPYPTNNYPPLPAYSSYFMHHQQPMPYFPLRPDPSLSVKLEQPIKTESEGISLSHAPKMEDIAYSQAETCESGLDHAINNIKAEIKTEIKTELEPSLGPTFDLEICLEAQTKYMIQFYVNNYGIITDEEIKETRPRYASNSKLLGIFDALFGRYSTTGKTREEMVKWIIRRSLKATKLQIKKNQKKDQKGALKDLCNRYFKGSGDGDDMDELDDDFVDQVLPFRKNSRNKTINTAFIMELFKSEEFKADYKAFLENFDEIIKKENTEKINKFIKLLMECSTKGNFKPILKYRRVPWLNVWMQNTKKIAEELEVEALEEKSTKKVK